jgi:hypothetical protein
MKELLLKAMNEGCKYTMQYVDYPHNSWTAPLLLTEDRINKMLSDVSVKEIRIIIEL